MGHKAFIGGTAYEISGGKTLVGGTAYKIDKGKTLVGGTAYEISFVKPPITLTVTGAGSTLTSGGVCYININGDNQQRYAGAGSTSWPITIENGSYIRCVAKSVSSGKYSYIYVNGTLMVSNANGTTSSYNYYPEDGANVTVDIRGNSSGMDKTIKITTS